MKSKREKRNALVGYDFQGWPIFKLTLEELLIGLGGKRDGNNIVFDALSPDMEIYPTLFEDDGMAYGVNEQCIIEAHVNKDKDNTNIIIFRENIPNEQQQKELFERWDEDERIFLEKIFQTNSSEKNCLDAGMKMNE